MAVTRADGSDFDAKNAGADLSAKVGYCCKIDTDGDVVLAGNGQFVAGIITEGAVEGKPVTFQHSGLGKGRAGAEITAGAKVMSNGSGEIVAATGAGANSFGHARNSVAAAGEIVEVQFDRTHLHA